MFSDKLTEVEDDMVMETNISSHTIFHLKGQSKNLFISEIDKFY